VGNLTNLITATPGPFILVGYGLGAMVISEVYEEIATGSLKPRVNDFLFGFSFGNPRRKH
jgi:predicted alpha/beta hydrolase family esterase